LQELIQNDSLEVKLLIEIVRKSIASLYDSKLTTYFKSHLIFNNPLKIKLRCVQALYVLMALIFAVILGLKIIELVKSGPVIESELIAPESLSPKGRSALDVALSSCDPNALSQSPLIASLAETDRRAIKNTHHLFCDIDASHGDKKSVQDWVKKQSYIAEDAAAWRGRFIHHYSTILFPYRQIMAGELTYAFTSQYGFISLIPLLLVSHVPFVLYGASGLVLLLILGQYFLYKHRQSSNETFIIGGILILIALVSYVPAIRLAPGFAVMRYLPLLLLIALADLQLPRVRNWYVALALLLALLNSLQFNILFVAICSTAYLLSAILQKKWNGIKLYWLPVVVMFVALLQGALYLSQANAFTPRLFSSVGEGKRSLVHMIEIFSFPVVCIIASYVPALNGGSSKKLSFKGHEILALVSYGLCATYALSFLGSPQHYAGFLVMASFSIFVLMKKYCKTKLMIVLALGLLLVVPIHYRYFSLGKKVFSSQSQLFEYKNELGTPIFFKTALEIEALSRDYEEITQPFQSKGEIYFISKDKAFIETFSEKNIQPVVYDVFTNFERVNDKLALQKFQEDRVSYLVLDSPIRRIFNVNQSSYFKNEIGSSEISALNKIYININTIEKFKIVKCNNSYCVYSI
jgi:hypothetical protein